MQAKQGYECCQEYVPPRVVLLFTEEIMWERQSRLMPRM